MSSGEVNVPKDLTKIKPKLFFNLTKRQVICFGSGALIGVPLYLFLRDRITPSLATVVMILTMMPFFLFAMYEKDGRPLEKILMMMFRQSVQRPGIRTYRTDNFYKKVQEEIYEKEVLGIGEKESRKAGRKAAGRNKRENTRKK